jgi:hypothetical protein
MMRKSGTIAVTYGMNIPETNIKRLSVHFIGGVLCFFLTDRNIKILSYEYAFTLWSNTQDRVFCKRMQKVHTSHLWRKIVWTKLKTRPSSCHLENTGWSNLIIKGKELNNSFYWSNLSRLCVHPLLQVRPRDSSAIRFQLPVEHGRGMTTTSDVLDHEWLTIAWSGCSGW